MAVTECIGGPCPRCGADRCFIRYGSVPDYFHYVACPSCGFARGDADDTVSETNGVISGAQVWKILFDSYQEADNLSDLEMKASETPEKHIEKIANHPIINFEGGSERLLDVCVATDRIIRSIVTARDATSEIYPTVADIRYNSTYKPRGAEMAGEDHHQWSESGNYALWLEQEEESENAVLHIQRMDRYYIPTSDRIHIDNITKNLKGRRTIYGKNGHLEITRDSCFIKNSNRIDFNELLDQLVEEL